MKHIHTFESFLNEANGSEIIFSVDDDKLDNMLHSRFRNQLDYQDIQGDSFYSLPKREFDRFIDMADSAGFDVDYENSEDSVIYVQESYVTEADDSEQKSTDRSPLDSEELETGVKNKAEETGCPIGIIRAVMRRGLAAWKSGHRPGAGQEQWAYARVNSFLTGGKGTWGGADADLAKEARAEGFDAKKKQ